MMYNELYQAMREGAADPAVLRWAVDVLTEIAAGRQTLTAVRHPLGFLCLPLERKGQSGVCVHVWSDKLDSGHSTTSTTHAHSWDLVSYVLFGELRNDLIGVTDAPAEPTHRVFEVNSEPGADEIRSTARLVRSNAATSELFRRGDVYSLAAGVFHETVPRGEAATVALGQARAGVADLTLGSVHMHTHRTRRQCVGPSVAAYAAGLVVDRIAAYSGPYQ
jgi:hypothetical protein